MKSAWFGAAYARVDGLFLPGTPPGHAASLLLGPDTVAFEARGATAELRWEVCGHQPGRPADVTWWIGEFALGRGAPLGVGIAVEGEAVPATAELRSATRTLRNRIGRLGAEGTVVPLKADFLIPSGVAEHDTLRALCTVLATSERKRRNLTDVSRIRQLIRDLADGALRALPETTGARRSTVEILSAMKVLGLRHPLDGRPVPGERRSDVEELVDRVAAHIGANPYAQGVSVSRDLVDATVRRCYAEVAPWPFAALAD